jgi:RimJ/RimL family protein N-acetyltransferase
VNIRPSVEADLERILPAIAEKSINTATPERYAAMLRTGEYRPEWTWVAEEDDRIAAVVVWWGFPTSEEPLALDGLFAEPGIEDPVPLWTELIRQVTTKDPSYHIFLPGDWRSDTSIAAALTPRLAEVFKLVAAGSLDAHTQETIARSNLDEYAREVLEIYTSMPGPREWWKLAYDQAGELVGFAMPSRNSAGPVVGFLGVVPGKRGHGYADDLLAEITADLADGGADRIVADTDVGNAPMAASFRRLGYRTFAVRLVMSKPVN